ncbi:178_t:CDS:2, partial [Gigaspora rosea]
VIRVPNSKTVFAICKWCKLKHGEAYAIENTQCVNKKDRLRSHFQNCINFKAAITKTEYEKLMQITKPKKKIASKSAVSILSATIENGWAFNWIEKKSSIAMLKYKNPNLLIPSRHTLGGRVLKNAIQELHLELALKAINDNIGVSLAFD